MARTATYATWPSRRFERGEALAVDYPPQIRSRSTPSAASISAKKKMTTAASGLPPWQRQGLMTEPAKPSPTFGSTPQLSSPARSQAVANVASRRLSEKQGMRLWPPKNATMSPAGSLRIWEITAKNGAPQAPKSFPCLTITIFDASHVLLHLISRIIKDCFRD